MIAFTETINFIAALGTLTIGACSIVLLVAHVVYRKKPHHILDRVTAWLLWLGLGIATMAIIASLVYSSIIGYQPCVLCWWQRVLIYPQVVLYAIALFTQDKKVFRYTLALSLIGLGFALYHNYIDFGGTELISCGTGVSCTMRYVYEFGFVTIPFMSLMSLIALTVIGWIGLERNQG